VLPTRVFRFLPFSLCLTVSLSPYLPFEKRARADTGVSDFYWDSSRARDPAGDCVAFPRPSSPLHPRGRGRGRRRRRSGDPPRLEIRPRARRDLSSRGREIADKRRPVTNDRVSATSEIFHAPPAPLGKGHYVFQWPGSSRRVRRLAADVRYAGLISDRRFRGCRGDGWLR